MYKDKKADNVGCHGFKITKTVITAIYILVYILPQEI